MGDDGHPLCRRVDRDGEDRPDLLGSDFFVDLACFNEQVARPLVSTDDFIETRPSIRRGGKLLPLRDQSSLPDECTTGQHEGDGKEYRVWNSWRFEHIRDCHIFILLLLL